jgi:hypothetical protein
MCSQTRGIFHIKIRENCDASCCAVPLGRQLGITTIAILVWLAVCGCVYVYVCVHARA